MGEIEGTYRTLQTPGTRLGSQFNAGISTLEPGQSLSTAMGSGGKGHCKGLQIRVQGLDDAQEFFDLEVSVLDSVLINLIESDYFGLEFQNLQMNWVWLEPTKLIVKQVRRPVNTLFRLSVKFFPPDPGQLQEEFTRYLFSLQMKRDLMEGRLYCTENTAALLASHLVQSEIGDYDEVADREFLKLNKLLPHQEHLQDKIMELHRRHLGQTPAESDFQVLEIARKLEMYGIRFHPAADREGTKINLSVAHMGLLVFQGNTKINTFNWSKIRKLSFKRKRFLIKLHPDVHGPHRDTLEFLMASRDQCKIFWKSCVEHHSFFRLLDQPQPKSKAILFTRGSSFRYSGRTQKQLVDYVRDSGLRRTSYQRFKSLLTKLLSQCLYQWSCVYVCVCFSVFQRYPTDKAYFIAKEILMTERTYLKDLEVITVWFRSAVIKENAMPEGLMTLLFSNIDPIYEFHRGFLKEIDQRLALWEGRSNAHVKGDYQRIGDVMLRNMCALKEFTSYLQKHDEVLTELEKATKRVKKLETVYKEFELQKVCYLPLNTFLLKPIQRLMHYKLILERLCKHYSPEHKDHHDCREALKEVAEIAAQLQSSLIRLENFQKLTELQRDLIGIENLTAPGREFIREGCLYKLTKKGLQQRMFFLFSDMLLYTSKGVTATNQFKVHGQLPLHGMIVSTWLRFSCLSLFPHMPLTFFNSTLSLSIILPVSLSACLSSVFSSPAVSPELPPRYLLGQGQRPNTITHVCWYRNQNLSLTDYLRMNQNQLSGYLLRKFKNSNGWQKLWVVFTNFCLFFYKTHQDDFPLASLPLLGYTVSTPGEADSIHKEYVFKLQFKSHVYFFRAESEYTFERSCSASAQEGSCKAHRNLAWENVMWSDTAGLEAEKC
uniref:FERM, ARHGEF and pleckstrin domain-containing protein 2 n=1 Tax=Astyanax mexicanus TaxID=7994 RepID=A0A8B9K9T0_ASTMX